MSGFFATAWTVPCKVSVHGISQARILEWVVISFSRGSFQPRDWTRFSCIGRWILYNWATREAPTYNSMATNTKECPPDFTCVCAKSLQSYLTLCNLRDCSSPGSSVHGILQARILEWVAMPSSGGSSQPRDRTCLSYVSCIDRWVLYH